MDEWISAEIWHYKKKNRQLIRSKLGESSDLTEDNFDAMLSSMAEQHVMMLSSGPTDIFNEYLLYRTRPIKDTKIARAFHKGSILSIENGIIRIMK